MDHPGGLSSLPERLVHRTAQALGNTRWSRRRFLTRTVVVGSALAVGPWEFASRPASAYAAVCGNDASCAGGYSVFCCTINNGANLCPPGSFTGGWWKADASGFCCGGPRYYVDCNAECGSGYGCECETSGATCDNRLIACNQFRYGQCNREIACYGPVVCRLVTCTPPWEYDLTCSTASATDDNTVSQTAPCLPGDCPSAIILRYYDLGGPGSYLGLQQTAETGAPVGGGTWVQFQYGAIFNVTPQGLHAIHGAIYYKYEAIDGPVLLGYPLNDEGPTASEGGAYNQFGLAVNDQITEVGAIYWTPELGAWSLHGAIYDHWAAMGYEVSALGYPVTDESGAADGVGRYNNFSVLANGTVIDNGAIYWTPQLGAWSIHGAIFYHWEALGYEASPVGYPVTDEGTTIDGFGRYNNFNKLTNGVVTDRGSIFWTPLTGAASVHGAIWSHWGTIGYETGPVGYPSSDEAGTGDGIGRYNNFTKIINEGVTDEGSIYWTPETGAWSLHGAIRYLWLALGAEASPLGYPVTDETGAPDGVGRYNNFATVANGVATPSGAIYYTPTTGVAAVYGVVYTKWAALGYETSPLGYPTADLTSGTAGGVAYTSQTFQNGDIYDSTVGAGAAIYGPIFTSYQSEGGPAGSLGLPTGSIVTSGSGTQTATFQHGTLTYSPSTGQVT